MAIWAGLGSRAWLDKGAGMVGAATSGLGVPPWLGGAPAGPHSCQQRTADFWFLNLSYCFVPSPMGLQV